MSEFLTEAVKATFYPPLCLWCEHFYLYVGSQGYSEMTPGSDFDMDCVKRHWGYERYSSERHYRKCILHAVKCPDFTVNPQIVKEIQEASSNPTKGPKRKGK